MNNDARTSLEELNLTDRFLFAETMDEPKAYEAMVSILLEDEITLAGYPQTGYLSTHTGLTEKIFRRSFWTLWSILMIPEKRWQLEMAACGCRQSVTVWSGYGARRNVG